MADKFQLKLNSMAMPNMLNTLSKTALKPQTCTQAFRNYCNCSL